VNCTKCKAEWKPPAGRTITNCPFCGEALIAATYAGNETALHEMLRSIVQQFGREILGETRLRGWISDLIPNAEKKHLRIFKQAVNDKIGVKLLQVTGTNNSGRALQITAIKDSFKNTNGFSNASDYVVDCFLFALGWRDEPPKEEQNLVQVNNLSILEQTVKIAFSDGKLTKEEAKSIFTMAETLSISEDHANQLIIEKLKSQNYKPEKPVDKTLKSKKEIIISRDWIVKNEMAIEDEYESINIGDQIWMKRNLDVSHFRNGDPIPEAKSNEEWKKAGKEEKPAWCYYKNDPKNGKIYGKLYNGYAVNDPRGLAPSGWHVPSDEEWENLLDFLGGAEVAEGKMKTIGTTHWEWPNKGATNSSGFSGLPGGCYVDRGFFGGIGTVGYWWCSNEYSSPDAWFMSLNYNSANARLSPWYKRCGLSVRCVKGNIPIKSLHENSDPNINQNYATLVTEKNKVFSNVIPFKGGLPDVIETVCSWTDSEICSVDERFTRKFKQGKYKGLTYFVFLTNPKPNCCCTINELMQLQIENPRLELCVYGSKRKSIINGIEKTVYDDVRLEIGHGYLIMKKDSILSLSS